MSDGRFVKGFTPWNKGKKSNIVPWNKGLSMPARHTTPHSEETKLKCSLAQKKRWAEGAYKNRVLDYENIAIKSRDTQLENSPRGKDHHFWKGGHSGRNTNSSKYRTWRIKVFERDNYTCQYCSARGCFLHAHHIKFWHTHKSLRFTVSNGLTLCKSCHYKLHSKRD